MSKIPTNVNVLGKDYSITYVDNPAEVDIYRRESLWGQVDYWTRTIRIYNNGRSYEDLQQTIIHEVLHVIAVELNLELRKAEMHDELGILALALMDVLTRNSWWVFGEDATIAP